MDVTLPNGSIMEFPDDTPQSIIDKYIEKYHPAEPNIVERTVGLLSKGTGRALEMMENFNQYSGMGVKEYPYQKQGVDVQEFFNDNKYANQVTAHPATSTIGQVLEGAVEFLPQIPIYTMGGGAVIRGAAAIPKVGKYVAPLLTKSANPIVNYGKAVARGTIEGGVVGSTIGVSPEKSLEEHLKVGAEDAIGFGIATAVLHPAFAGLGIIGRGIVRRLGKKATPERVEAELSKRAETNPQAAEELQAFKNRQETKAPIETDELYVPKGKEEATVQGELDLEPIPPETIQKFKDLGYTEKDIEAKTDAELENILDNNIVKEITSDKTNEPGIPGRERGGEAVEQGELEQVAGETKVETSGDVQALEGKAKAEALSKIKDAISNVEERIDQKTKTLNKELNKEVGDNDYIEKLHESIDTEVARHRKLVADKKELEGEAAPQGKAKKAEGTLATENDVANQGIADALGIRYDGKTQMFGKNIYNFTFTTPSGREASFSVKPGKDIKEVYDKKVKEFGSDKVPIAPEKPTSEHKMSIADKRTKESTQRLMRMGYRRDEIKKMKESDAQKIFEDYARNAAEADRIIAEKKAKGKELITKIEEKQAAKVDEPPVDKEVLAEDLQKKLEEVDPEDFDSAADIIDNLRRLDDPVMNKLLDDLPKTDKEIELAARRELIEERAKQVVKERPTEAKPEAPKTREELEKFLAERRRKRDPNASKKKKQLQDEWEKKLREEGMEEGDAVEVVFTDKNDAEMVHELDFEKGSRTYDEIEDGVYLDSFGASRFQKIYEQAAKYVKDKGGLVQLGKSVYLNGYHSFEGFVGKCKEVLGETWNSVRRYAREAYKAAKEWNDKLGERGSIRVGHGTAKDFERVSNEYIGSGEGAQVRGWGHYFSTGKDVYEWYAKKIGGKKTREYSQQLYKVRKSLENSGLYVKSDEGRGILDVYIDDITHGRNNRHKFFKDSVEANRGKGISDEEYFNLLTIARELEKTKPPSSKYVHEFELPIKGEDAEGLNILDLDKPIKPEQAEAIAKALREFVDNRSNLRAFANIHINDRATRLARDLDSIGQGESYIGQHAKDDIRNPMTGDVIVPAGSTITKENLSEIRRVGWEQISTEEGGTQVLSLTGDHIQSYLRHLFGDKEASKFLWEKAGIHGNTFIGDSSGVRNYVIFDDQFVPPKIGTYTLDFMGLHQIFEMGKKIVNSFTTHKNAASTKVLSEVNGKQLTKADDANFVEGSVNQMAHSAKEFFRFKGMSPDFAVRNNARLEPLVTNMHLKFFDANFAASKRNEIIRIAHTMIPDKAEQLLVKPYLERGKWEKELAEIKNDIVTLQAKPVLTKAEAKWLANAPEKLRRAEKMVLEESKRVYPEHVVKAAEMIKSELADVREKYKGYLRDQMQRNLNEDENAALAEILSGKPIDEVIAKYKEHVVIEGKVRQRRVLRKWLDEAVIRDIVNDYNKIDKWGLDDYITHFERGPYRIVSGGKLYAKAVSVEDAARKFEKLVEMYPDQDFKLDTSHNLEGLATGISKRSYNLIVNNLQKGILEAVDGMNSALARRAAEKGLENRFWVKPAKEFSPFVLERHEHMQGEENVFDVLYHYFYSMEKKIALDPAIDAIRKAISRKDIVGTELYKDRRGNIKERDIKRPYLRDDEVRFLEQYVEDIKGRLYKEDELVDALFKNSANPRLYSRAVQVTRELQANLKLGYAPVKGFINGASALGHVWTKVGTKFTKDGVEFLRTEEGKKFIKDMEPYLGINIVESASGELSTKGFYEKVGILKAPKTRAGRIGHAVIEPLGLFQAPELPMRKLTLAANYLMAKSEGMTEEAARMTAIKANWFQQFTYDMASLPELMRSPTGRLLTQFKPYLLKEIEFISTLRGAELGRYMAMQVALGGPRGLVMVAKSLPFIGMWYGWTELEDWANKNYPVASRGIGGAMGVDITAAATFQLPTRWQDWFGPTISDLSSLFKDVLIPSVGNAINYMTGGGPENMEQVEGGKALKTVFPIARHWANIIEQVIDKDGWVKDERNRRQWHIDDMASFMTKSVAGAEPIELNRLRVAEYNLTQKELKLGDQKTALVDDLLDTIAKGEPLEQSQMDSMVRLGIKPSTLRRAAKFRVLDPKMRRLLMTEIIRRPEILEKYPDAGDLE